jgi:hypothetical protein
VEEIVDLARSAKHWRQKHDAAAVRLRELEYMIREQLRSRRAWNYPQISRIYLASYSEKS